MQQRSRGRLEVRSDGAPHAGAVGKRCSSLKAASIVDVVLLVCARREPA
jgi:hypothetical protein